MPLLNTTDIERAAAPSWLDGWMRYWAALEKAAAKAGLGAELCPEPPSRMRQGGRCRLCGVERAAHVVWARSAA